MEFLYQTFFNYERYLQDALEQNISQLVVDDDEIDDPAIMTITKRQPVPQVNLPNRV